MSLSQPIRTFLLAGILIITAVVIRNSFESDLPAPPVEEEFPLPIIRVARDTQPTIVESNEDWLETPSDDQPVEANSPLAPPDIPHLPRAMAGSERAPDDNVLIR